MNETLPNKDFVVYQNKNTYFYTKIETMAHFRVRYATYNGRFRHCSMTESIEYENGQATSFPQNQGSLEAMLRHGKLPQAEDSFFVDIWTPESEELKPVLFWIHGGAFVSGASGDIHNNAENLSRNANIVVVSVSYRLGFLGTANFDGIPQKNCGFHDIVTALEWTNRHIEHFGGDTRNITVGGQSSGAWYAMAIHTSPRLQHLFHKTILFSWPGTMQAISEETSCEISNQFQNELKKQFHTTLDNAKLDDILSIQRNIGKFNKKRRNFLVPFLPCIETDYISEDFYSAIRATQKKIFLQYTQNECGIYVYKFPIGKHTPISIISPFLKRYCPENTYQKLKASRKQTHDSYQTVVDVTSDILFFEPTRKIIEICKDKAVFNAFTYPAPNKKTQCCHCFDIPFLFGNIENWQTSKIFRGCDFSSIRKESTTLQKKIAEFIFNG